MAIADPLTRVSNRCRATATLPSNEPKGCSVATEATLRRVRYKEAAERIGVPAGTLRSMVHRKQVPHIRLSDRRVLFDVAELDAWLLSRTVAASGALR